MFRTLLLVTVLVNSFIFSLGVDFEDIPEEIRCPAALERFTDAVLYATTNALKVLAYSTCETVAVSPITSLVVLAAFDVYAANKTRSELNRVLNLRNNDEIYCVTAELIKEARNITGCAKLDAAPCVFANSRYPLSSAFKKTVETVTLDGFAENLNFSESEKAGNTVNRQIAQRLDNVIKRAVPDYSIFNSSAQFVAVGAIYLLGDWQIAFQKTTNVTQFRISPTESKPQTFLYQDAKYYYTYSETLSAQVVQINLCLDQLSILVLLPDSPFTENDLIDKMAKNNDWYYEVKDTLKLTRLDLYIPYYNKSTTLDTGYIIRKATGIKTLYNNKTIELSGVTKQQIAISAEIQTTNLIASFDGGPVPKGATKGPKKTFKADYPHVFIIFRYGRAIFTGIFRQPVA